MPIHRHSSRSSQLDTGFLARRLQGASRYLRIAGYFRGSIFELVGEEISRIPEVKIVCNSELDLKDFQVATGRDTALKERWNQVDVGAEAVLHQERYARLDALLTHQIRRFYEVADAPADLLQLRIGTEHRTKDAATNHAR